MCRHQLLNYSSISPSLDVWSAAATFYYLLTAKFPRNFTSNDPFYDILRNPVIPIQQQNLTIPNPLAKIIDLALKESDSLHFQTVQEFKKSLKSL